MNNHTKSSLKGDNVVHLTDKLEQSESEKASENLAFSANPNNHKAKLANYSHKVNLNFDKNIELDIRNALSETSLLGVAPFFSMRKLRLVYNQLKTLHGFEYASFDAFKHQVLNAVAPQMELNKWQSIAARR